MVITTKAWLRKKEPVLTLLGLFIVIMTFIVKEGLGDSIRDSVSSMENARDAIAIEIQSGAILRDLAELQDYLETPRPTDPQNYWGKSALRRAADLKRDFRILTHQWKKLGPFTDNVAIEKEFAELTTRAERVEFYSGWAGRDAPPNINDGLVAALKEFRNAYERASLAEEWAEDGRVFFSIDNEIERKRQWQDRATWVSYFLFAVGWVITAAGKLAHLGQAEPVGHDSSIDSLPGLTAD